MSSLKIILIIGLCIVLIGGCIVTLFVAGVGGYLFYKTKPVAVNPTPVIRPIETIQSDISENPTSIPTETTSQETPTPDGKTNNSTATYLGTGDPNLPAGVRLIYDEDGKNYEDFQSGEPYEFAQKLFKHSRWEISGNKFAFIPGTQMPRNDLYPIKGTAMEAGKMIALTNFSTENSGGDDKNEFNIAGNINLDRSKPELQVVFEYKFEAKDDLNFGIKKGNKGKLTITVMQEMEKK